MAKRYCSECQEPIQSTVQNGEVWAWHSEPERGKALYKINEGATDEEFYRFIETEYHNTRPL